MKIEITKKNIIITPAPKKDKKNGLKVWFWREEKPEDTTFNLIKNQRKYKLPDDFKYVIKSIEF